LGAAAGAIAAVGYLLSCPAPAAAAAETAEVDVAIVFLADMSKSMDAFERRILRQSHASAVTSPTVIAAIKDGEHRRVALAYVEFGNVPIVRVPWSVVEGKDTAAEFAAAILRSPMEDLGFTGIGGGIRAAEKLFANCPCRPKKRVVDVVGDGKDNTIPSLYLTRISLLATGATINGLPMVIDPWDEDIVDYFAKNVIGGPGAFNLPVARMDELPERLRQKILLDLY
jgi:hypothetical protein